MLQIICKYYPSHRRQKLASLWLVTAQRHALYFACERPLTKCNSSAILFVLLRQCVNRGLTLLN